VKAIGDNGEENSETKMAAKNGGYGGEMVSKRNGENGEMKKARK
jgi:hypothetical protein